MSWKKFHNPKNPEKVYEMAKQALRSKDFDRAEKIYKLLAESAKESARPLVGLARAAMGRNDLGKALEHLDAAEARNKAFVHIFAERGVIMTQKQLFDDAFKAFDQAIALSPLNPVRYKQAAEVLFNRNRFQEAAILLERAVSLGLEFKQLYHYLSQACFATREYVKAIKYVRSALAKEPENLTYLNQLGICLKQQNQFDEANKVYNQIIKRDPENVATLYNKAMLCEARSEPVEAIKLLERALKIDPDFVLARAKLDEFKAKYPSAS
jgi:tetratricopeptide (TPR) repeat protein